ncbi:MAG: hypothetical protein J3K34DRAFT_521751 [Monoraphidium minutum]|nr:MAG: hypothetical protein J3K34DRAFT_521751 [Monoraphidium minutum]
MSSTPGSSKRAKLEAGDDAAAPVEPMAVDDTRPGPSGDQEQQQQQAAAAAKAVAAPKCTRDQMQQYYSRLFPAHQMHKWLAYGNDSGVPGADPSFATRREMCFTLEGDIFARYQSFATPAQFASALCSKVPTKIDIGPIYTVDPRQRAKYAKDFRPLQRELVFDVDLTDYDDVRSCGQGGHICRRCWPLMAAAVVVVDAALREDFGFKHITWVYSGRRGVHCWVCDESARTLPDDARGGVINYLTAYRGAEGDRAKISMGANRHPSLARAHAALSEAWRRHILPEQALLDDPGSDAAARLLRYIPDEELTEQLRRSWAAGGGARAGRNADNAAAASVSVRRWDELVSEVEAKAAAARRGGNRARAAALGKGLADALFAHAYPRLDVEVSKKMNHLLKAPFCVHPKTGRVCVPLDVDAIWEFDPEEVPSLGGLLREVKEADASKDAAREDAWRSTALGPAITAWEAGFLAPLARDSKARTPPPAAAQIFEAPASPPRPAALASRAAKDAAERARGDASW